MEQKTITAAEADKILANWERTKQEVGFALFFGAWAVMLEKKGLIEGSPLMWVHASKEIRTSFSTSSFRSITLNASGGDLGLIFEKPNGTDGFELRMMVFVPPEVKPRSLLTDIIQ